MPLGGERATVQNPFIRYATETGWQYVAPSELELYRGGVGGLIVRDVFIKQLQKLNPGVVDHLRAEEVLKRLERVPPNIEGNLQAWEYLKGLAYGICGNREKGSEYSPAGPGQLAGQYLSGYR